ncbi:MULTISPECIES: ankyrin repeat domain-containing protein [Frankia]|uniref:Ankyrin-repeat containing protein n=1 Tax=Frankia alni (strain DSM 45986 / CECT 9034 / ACN14a) TaxID=326424 RepID=Q0RU13_FRAAA|nr:MULTISPECIES: ankyrin repeat domain-containing protein [Frankia]CAJ58931.1 putative Ankyrin-repeat containing protein [Frankia alni ACN14a]
MESQPFYAAPETAQECTEWFGYRRDAVSVEVAAVRERITDAARDGDWEPLFRELDAASYQNWVNSTRLDGHREFAPLHQAAWHGASSGIVAGLLSRGAWRTLRTTRGERPIDIAAARGHSHLADVLRPVVRHPLSVEVVVALERRLHPLLAEVSMGLTEQQRMRLPQVAVLTEISEGRLWFPVPGMYGGADIRLEAAEGALIVESWCRVVEGSGCRHRVTPDGTVLLAEGFV